MFVAVYKIRLTTAGMVIPVRAVQIVRAARELQVILDDKPLKQSEHFKYLGLRIDNRLSWNFHIAQISFKIYPKLKMLNRISSY